MRHRICTASRWAPSCSGGRAIPSAHPGLLRDTGVHRNGRQHDSGPVSFLSLRRQVKMLPLVRLEGQCHRFLNCVPALYCYRCLIIHGDRPARFRTVRVLQTHWIPRGKTRLVCNVLSSSPQSARQHNGGGHRTERLPCSAYVHDHAAQHGY